MYDSFNLPSIHDLVASLDTIKNKNYLTHNIHPYPAKFIPQIPGCIIEIYSEKGDSILDPFCGSGTSLLESIIRGRNAFGIDINPIAILISNIKTCILQSEDIDSIRSFEKSLIQALFKMKSNYEWIELNISSRDIPQFLNRDHWFQRNMQTEIALIKNFINKYAKSKLAKEYLLLCLSAVIVKVSNQESNTRWKAVQKDLPNLFAIHCFLKILRENLKKTFHLEEFLHDHKTSVVTKKLSISNLSDLLNKSSIDLVVTSPPYLNSYDYYLYHKLRMFWLDYNHKEVQKEEIGSRNKHCDQNEGIDTFITTMKSSLSEITKVLKKNGNCVFIVGDSILKGKIIDMSKIYDQIAQEVGLQLDDRASFEQRKYSKSFTPNLKRGFKKTHILVFKKR